tara:strand:+ start:2086 stop:2544 length:459 start_codon:yes stop_codon:yes gene_type:complete
MTIINVKGGKKYQQKYAKSMIAFCVSKLMPRKKDLEINLHLKDLKELALGYAWPEDISSYPKEFNIEIDSKQKLRDLLVTLAHEMVHVKQFSKGELYESTKVSKHRWQGKWLKKDLEYWDRPWEIEAHGREIGLFVRWCEDNKIGHLKWTQD